MTIRHPGQNYLVSGSFPTAWCSGCGIGTVVHTLIQSIRGLHLARSKMEAVLGMGCSTRIVDILDIPSATAPDGHVVRMASDRKEKNPEKTVICFMNNADLLLSGAKDLMKANRQRPVLILHINNIVLAASQNGFLSMTPYMRKTPEEPADLPYNVPYIACTAGASYIARWIPLRAGWLKHSITEALQKKELAYIEVVAPCLVYDAGTRRILDAAERMEFYDSHSLIDNNESLKNLSLKRGDKIILGKFIDNQSS